MHDVGRRPHPHVSLLVCRYVNIVKANTKLQEAIAKGEPRDIVEKLEIYLQVRQPLHRNKILGATETYRSSNQRG